MGIDGLSHSSQLIIQERRSLDDLRSVTMVDPGQRFTFSPCHDCHAADVVTPGAHGTITVSTDDVRISNHSPRTALHVSSYEHPSQHVIIPPLISSIPIPFEAAAIAGASGMVLLALSPPPGRVPAHHASCQHYQKTINDPFAKQVLYYLCQPRLTGDYQAHLPTLADLARAVNASLAHVDRALDHLVHILNLTPPEPATRGWRTQHIARYALAHDLVAPPHENWP